MEDVTFIIKTLDRPKHLNLLIESIKKYYPDVKIIVADDSREPEIREDVEYHVLPFDTGVSAGRNYLVDKVKTKYFLLLDDDYVFTEDTKIEVLREKIEKFDLDILAGAVRQNEKILEYYGTFKKEDDVVKYVAEIEDMGEYIKSDLVPFFFIAKKGVRWDDYLKNTEHFDFFYTILGKKNIGFIRDVIIDHERDSFNTNEEYKELRFNRRSRFLKYILKKHNLKRLISFGEEIKC